MEVTETQVDGTLVIAPRGRLDSNTAPEFEQRLLQSLTGKPRLVLDLAGLDYISSAGLRVLLMAAKKVKQGQGRLALCELQAPIREIFEISGFLSILDVRATRAEALAELAA